MNADVAIQLERTIEPKYTVHLATSSDEILQAQALRYQVFAEEMGAQLHSERLGYDIDHYDAFCHHLLVRRQESQQIVGCTRILTSDNVAQAGGFYSESEFDLSPILQLSGRFMEIGRTCVHPAFRNSHVLGLLWSGLAQFMVMGQFNYLMGCASIPMPNDYAHSLFERLQQRYAIADSLRVTPRLGLRPLPHEMREAELTTPPLLKAYLRSGAQVCGEPCWDPDFKVADLLIFLDMANLQRRYMKHFVDRAQTSMITQAVAA
jgi:putative hemolysin